MLGTARISVPHCSGYFAGYAITSAGSKIHLQNVSSEGIGFTSAQLLDVGKTYILQSESHTLPPGAAVRITWCRETQNGGGYQGGAEFC